MGKSEGPVHERKPNSQPQWLNYTAFKVHEFEIPEKLIKINNKWGLCSEETLNIMINPDFDNVWHKTNSMILIIIIFYQFNDKQHILVWF
jgi:hypothetical protein